MSAGPDAVARLGQGYADPLATLLSAHGLSLTAVAPGEPIPGSYWGEPEAGLRVDAVYARADTPVHSVLHEAAHAICMGEARRAHLSRDAGGDHAEENAVCYLQVLLAEAIGGYGADRCLLDMDRWGYTFRLGSARAWFETDADDARAWLEHAGLLKQAGGQGRARA